MAALMTSSRRPLYDSSEAIPANAERAVALLQRRADLSFPQAVLLMLEGVMHADNVEAGLRRALELDSIVRATASRMPDDDTLIVFTADYSFDLLVAGRRTHSAP